MEKSNNLKSTYYTLFLLTLIETVLYIFMGNFVAVATFVIALILRSNLPKGTRTPLGIKLIITCSVLHFLFTFFSLFIVAIVDIADTSYSLEILIFSLTLCIVFIIYLIATFVLLIISCVQLHAEYKAIDNY